MHKLHWGSWPGGGRGLFPSAAPGFEPSCARLSPPRCLTCPLGLQGVQCAVRLVVVRASWPEHPRKYIYIYIYIYMRAQACSQLAGVSKWVGKKIIKCLKWKVRITPPNYIHATYLFNYLSAFHICSLCLGRWRSVILLN